MQFQITWLRRSKTNSTSLCLYSTSMVAGCSKYDKCGLLLLSLFAFCLTLSRKYFAIPQTNRNQITSNNNNNGKHDEGINCSTKVRFQENLNYAKLSSFMGWWSFQLPSILVKVKCPSPLDKSSVDWSATANESTSNGRRMGLVALCWEIHWVFVAVAGQYNLMRGLHWRWRHICFIVFTKWPWRCRPFITRSAEWLL